MWLIIYFKKRKEKKIPEKKSERSDGRESCTWKGILCSFLKKKPEKSEDQGKKIADSVNSAEVNGKDVFSGKDGRGVSFVLAVLGEEEEEEEEETPAAPISAFSAIAIAVLLLRDGKQVIVVLQGTPGRITSNFFNKKIWFCFFEKFWGFFSWQVLKVCCEEV